MALTHVRWRQPPPGQPLVRAGQHVLDARVSVYQAREVTLDAPDLAAYADGEHVGPLPVTATCVPAALRVFVR